MSYNIGPKIGVDGEKEFRNQLKQINNAYKTLTAETKAATAAFDAAGDEQGKLKKTGEQLQKQIDLQKQKVSLLSDMVQKATAKFGENSDEVTRLKGVMYDAQASLSGLEGELKDVNQKLKEDTDAVEDLGNETDETQEKIVDFSDILSAGFLSDALYNGLQELSGKLKEIAVDSVQAASDVAAETAQFEQTFGGLKDTATDALQSISDTTHIAVTRLQGSYTKLYAFSKTVGAGQEQALNISSRALIAAADSAAYYDRSIDEALESLQAFLKGNYANDAALGIAATETSRNTMANKLYAKSFNELSESQKVETLLAMVEAGNAASGALGQAAREADAWTNVTGELNEAWRQLLAKVGAPVLKKLTPIVKSITNTLYDMAEDIDWDRFADTVSAIIDFLLKNLPKITNGLISIGAGLVAMKLAKVAIDFGQIAGKLFNVVTGAQSASDAIKGLNAAMNTTPWGWISSAIGWVVGGITYLCLNSQQAEVHVSALGEAMENFAASMEEAEQSYRTTITEIDGAAFAAQCYLDRLRELETASLNTNSAQQEYRMCIEQLNALIPSLNLSISEQTGLLIQSVDAIEAEVDAWKRRAAEQALYEKYSDVITAQGEATATLTEWQLKLKKVEDAFLPMLDKLEKKRQRMCEITEQQDEILDQLSDTTNLSVDEIHALQDAYEKLEDESYKLDAEIDALNGEVEDMGSVYRYLKGEVEDAEAVVASYDQQIEEAGEALDYFQQSTTDAAGAVDEGSQAVEEALFALQSAYDETKAEAYDALSSQIDLWEELDTESSYTAKSIVDNWKKQKKAFENYDKNLRLAVEKGLDLRIVQDLSDGSVESMQILDALVNDTNFSVDEINAAFGERLDVQGELSETMGAVNLLGMPETKTVLASASQLGGTIVGNLISAIKSNTDTIGESLIEGAIVSIDNNISYLLSAVYNVGTQAGAALKRSLKVNSPSKVSEEIFEFVIDGGVVGVEKNAARLLKEMEQLGDASAYAFLSDKLRNVTDHIGSITMPNTSNTSIDRRNYGGFHFTVYQQPGESAENLTSRIMDEIQTVVGRKGAVFNA